MMEIEFLAYGECGGVASELVRGRKEQDNNSIPSEPLSVVCTFEEMVHHSMRYGHVLTLLS